MQQLPDALRALANYRQFILWNLIDGKKLPVSPHTGAVINAHDSTHWVSADEAVTAANGRGVAFVFTAADPFFFLDIDKCTTPDGKDWSDLAKSLMAQLPGAAVEVSQSGTGLHIFGTGQVPPHGCKNIEHNIELYTENRFVALTGTGAVGDAAIDCSAGLGAIVNTFFVASTDTGGSEWTTEASAEWYGPEDDDELIKRALASKSAAGIFGGRASFKELWAGDSSAYGNDDSSADAALAQHLAFWTGKNCERIERIMRRSGLVRDKWEREDYLPRTITKAISMQKDVYCLNKPVDRVVQNVTEPTMVAGYQFLAVDQQLEFFKGCVYVKMAHKVLTPDGLLLKPEQFNATYGGYVFQLDNGGSGKATRKAWEAFTESQAVRYPQAETTCFKPCEPPGLMTGDDGRLVANTYVPIEPRQIPGDPAPFLRHLAKILPDRHDREILLAYMAACIQYKGIKFQWAPLLQGTEGNGKTLFTRCVAYAIGERYTHYPPAHEITEKFNDWLFDRLFIGIEDIYVPEHKREVIQVLLPMITNDRLACRAMNQGQITRDVCANFMLNTNPKEALRKTRNDRRFAVFYTAQQSADDLERDGMGGDYFPRLYTWLRTDGYAIVADYLTNYKIPEALNPATLCHRAPRTSSNDAAIESSLGAVEQEVLEAIDEGRQGFAGGWVSSIALDKLLDQLRAARFIPPQRRRELMQSLGYDWHPALNAGRVNNSIAMDDHKKPRLYIKRGHLMANLTSPSEVAKAYQAAQGVTPAAMAL